MNFNNEQSESEKSASLDMVKLFFVIVQICEKKDVIVESFEYKLLKSIMEMTKNVI